MTEDYEPRARIQKEELEVSCDSHFQGAFTSCCCVFKVITQVCANQGSVITLKTQMHAVNAR